MINDLRYAGRAWSRNPGFTVAAILSIAMQNLLFGVGAADPATFVPVSLLLLVVALVASHGPARRAAQIDPMDSLWSE